MIYLDFDGSGMFHAPSEVDITYGLYRTTHFTGPL